MKKLFLLLLLLPTGVFAQNQARMISGTNNITTCPYTIQKQDVTKLDVFITSTACAVTLPAATVQGFGKGSIFSVKNNGTGSVTITPTGESIDGNASVTLLPGAGMDIYSTGTGYSSQPGSGSGGGGGGGINPPAGDIGGNAVVPLVISTHLNSPLPILQGGTGTQTPGSVAGTGMTITGSWPNETFSTTSACWQNNGSALTCEPFTNAVPPLVATLNVGNSTIDLTCPAAVGVGGSHASGCVPDPGASGTTTDYLGRDMAYHTAVGASTILPDPATSIQYVAGTCNGGSACTDTNNGLSWGAAKLTISAAVQALPGGGGGTAGTGTVFVGVGAVPNAAGNQYGMWFMASADPNFGSPPTGWLKCTGGGGACDLNIVGVPNGPGAPNPHEPRVLMNLGSQIVTTTPAIWLSDVATLHFSNMQFQYPGRAFVMGECSNGTRTGTCPVTGVTFDNMGALLNQTATNGPCTDITGQSYWLWFKDFGCGGNAIAATGGRFANNAAAVLVDDSLDNGSGLIHIRDANFSAGGIKVIPGVNGSGLYAENVTEEGDFTHDIPPAVWFTSFPAQTDCRVSNIQIADAGPSGVAAVKNDGNAPGCTVINTLSPTPVQGANVVVSSDPRAVTNSTTSPRAQKQVGFFNGYSVAETDVARRLAALTSTRFISVVQVNPSLWSAAAATITTGQTDPFGGTLGGLVASGSTGSVNFGGGCGAYTPAAGDWILMGAWKKDNVTPPTGATISIQNCGFPAITFSAQYNNGALMKSDGQWSFVWTAYKVGSGSATQIGAGMVVTSAASSTVYGPTMFVIPAATLSDNEVLEFASSMNSSDSTCKLGAICNVQGHPISADTFSLRSSTSAVLNFQAASVAASRTVTAADPLGSAALPLMTGSITNGNNVCASGTAGLITTVGCTGGGGAGTVDAALQYSLTYYNTAGTVSHVGGVQGPTGPNSVPSFWVTIPSGSAATAPQPILAGIPGRTVSGASDTVLVTDRVSTVTYSNAGATAISLPGAGTTGFGSNFCFKMIVIGSGAVATITPASGTINGGATQTVLQGQKALVCSFDNSNYIATINDPPAAAGTNMALTRGDTSLSFASSAGGGTVTHTAGALSLGQLIVGNAAADLKTGDLTGDVTTSGSTATTVTAIRGTSFAGTNGDLVSFGAANIPADSGIIGTNVITSTGTLLAGNLVSGTAAKNVGPTSIPLVNVVTSTANAGFASQICASGSTDKTCAYTSLTDLTSTGYAGTTTGAVNVLAACPTNTSTALATGMVSRFLPNLANTTTNPTYNLCTLGAKTITKHGTAVLAVNDLTTIQPAEVQYDGTEWVLLNPDTERGSGAVALSGLVAASASNTLANGNFPQTWNWAQTTNTQSGITFGETSAATAGTVTSNLANQANVKISTASASTATPLSVLQGSVTGTTAFPAAQFKTTWNNAGLVGQGVVISVVDTAHGSGAKLLNVFGGASGTTSLMSVDPSGALTVGSCNGCVPTATLSNFLSTAAVSRWGFRVWSHANGGFNGTGSFLGGTGICTTPGDTGASATDPPYQTCATGAIANTVQFEGLNPNGDAFIGTSSNKTNLHASTAGKQSTLTAVRYWPVVITNLAPGTMAGTDSPSSGNVAAIRFSSVAGDTNYMLVLCNAAACNATSTGVAADTNFHHFDIQLDDGGTATGCVDGTCISSSTDYPGTVAPNAQGVGMILDNTSTSSVTMSFSGVSLTTIR